MEEYRKKSGNRSAFGIILILIGLVFIAKITNIIPHGVVQYIFTWQMLLISIGVVLVSSRENKSTGLILIIIGGIFLLPDIIHVPFGIRRFFWPILLISIGLIVVFRSAGRFDYHSASKSNIGIDYIDDVAILGGSEKYINSNNFKGGKITSFFGGSKIDLRQATLAEGNQLIDVFCVFGGSTLIVPEEWNIRVDVISIFGGFSDKRIRRSDKTNDLGKSLTIKGIVLFGGGEIK
ncbi:MAG: LiaF-related protein [Bacteroidales bacterium]|jgi:predicted membrane protein|nr:LiaF-related protein [Bacteroidales bacterium]